MKREIMEHFGGLHWIMTNTKGETLSVICHKCSYGFEHGLFEIMPSWRKPRGGDSVKGHMDFGDVQRWINELKRREAN
jgi:hypothetical protein